MNGGGEFIGITNMTISPECLDGCSRMRGKDGGLEGWRERKSLKGRMNRPCGSEPS